MSEKVEVFYEHRVLDMIDRVLKQNGLSGCAVSFTRRAERDTFVLQFLTRSDAVEHAKMLRAYGFHEVVVKDDGQGNTIVTADRDKRGENSCEGSQSF